MTKRWNAAAVLVLLAMTAAPAGAADRREELARHGRGYLEIVNGLPTLHVEGAPEEMGEQYGALAGDRVAAAVAFIDELVRKRNKKEKFLPGWLIKPLRRLIGWAFWTQFPSDVKAEIRAMVKGAAGRSPSVKLHRYDVAFLNSIIDIVGILHGKVNLVDPGPSILKALGIDWIQANCDSFAAWGPRTEGGKTFQTRNVDISTGLGLENFPLVVVYKPEGKIPYVTAAFAGFVGVFTGMNAHGVGVGQIWGYSEDRALGQPWAIQMKTALSRAETAEEAVALFESIGKRTYGSNFVLADGAGHGFAIETSPAHFSVFRDGDPRELEAKWNGEVYGIPLENAVFRADCALDPSVRARQTASNGPDGDPREANAYRSRYKGQADRIVAYEQSGVLIGKEQAEAISRETAARDGSLQTTVYANSDLELWVSYAKILPDGTVRQAYEGVYEHIPFGEYLR